MIDDVHGQGGVAIAAHPTRSAWARWPDAALRKLDGSEVIQPVAILDTDAGREMREFHARARGAAIGSSDYHGMGPLGICRTYVLARDNSEAAILDAVRAGRTLPAGPEASAAPSALVMISRVCGVLGLLLIVLRPGWRRRSEFRRS